MQNFFFSCKELRIEPTSPKTYYGCFYLGPFSNGQGLTVANALRRTLLSEISGLAITSVKVNNAYHEYSTLPGVRETVLDIMLNLKEIVLKKQSNKPLVQTQVGYLQVRGPGIVRASDLKLPPMIQCIDPDQYIATLAEDGSLYLKFKIDEGKNFVFLKNSVHVPPAKSISQADVAFLPIDTVFTPIKKVNYLLESYGAESIEKSNQVIILEVWTNGSISPKEAISQTLNYLRVLFTGLGQLKILQSVLATYSLADNQNYRDVLQKIHHDLDLAELSFAPKKQGSSKITDILSTDVPKFVKQKTEEDFLKEINKQTRKEWQNKNLNDLGLPFRVFNCFYKANIQTIGQILDMDVKELRKIPGFGPQALLVLKENLDLKNLTLKEN